MAFVTSDICKISKAESVYKYGGFFDGPGISGCGLDTLCEERYLFKAN